MLLIGPLRVEHRLIERLIALMKIEGDRIKKDKLTDIDFIDNCIDFIKTYADRCHHGKEEDILFKELEAKELKSDHKKLLKELVEEHNYIREITLKLLDVRNRYFNSNDEATKQILAFEIYEYIKYFINFYPNHIEKEDKDFFLPSMDYFTDKEKNKMIDKFLDFDRKLIHEKYKKVLEKYE